MGLELQAIANYQFNNNTKQLAAMLGEQETGQAECSHYLIWIDRSCMHKYLRQQKTTLFNHSNEVIRRSCFQFFFGADLC
jgi:hypothetical protein